MYIMAKPGLPGLLIYYIVNEIIHNSEIKRRNQKTKKKSKNNLVNTHEDIIKLVEICVEMCSNFQFQVIRYFVIGFVWI